jgi:DNA-binding PadR family transcriptional regulator
VSAKHALLGLLLHRPAHGYQLGERLQERLGPAWAINSGQLYQTIKRLESDGLIERVGGGAQDHEDRTVFAITDSGVDEFEDLQGKQDRDTRPLRRPLFVKIALAGPNRLKDTLQHIDAYERECATLIKELSCELDRFPVDGLRVRADLVLLRLGLSADIAHFQAELGWARHAHEVVAWLLNQDNVIWPMAHDRSGEQTRDELFARFATRQRQRSSLREEEG